MLYVVSEYAKFIDNVLINVEVFDNEVRAKNYMSSRIEDYKLDFCVADENVGEDYGYLSFNHREYWVRIHKRELK